MIRDIFRPSHRQSNLKTLVVRIRLVDVEVIAHVSAVQERRVVLRADQSCDVFIIRGERGGEGGAELMRNTHFVFRRPFGVEIRLAEDRLADMDVVLRVLVQAFVVGILKEMSVREMESRPVADRVSHPEAGAPLRLRFRRNNDRAVKRVAPERRPLIGVIETEATLTTRELSSILSCR